MTQAIQPIRTVPAEVVDPLRQRLADLGRSRRLYAWFAAALRGLAVWLLALLLLVILDAAWPLPTPARWALFGGLLLLLPGLVLWHRRERREAERELLGDVRTLERRTRADDNALVSGIQVGPLRHNPADRFAATLAQRAHQRALFRFEQMEQTDRDAVIDRRTLHRQAGNLYAAAAGWLIVLLIHPGLLGGGLVRLALPWGDHPPFALTQLDVTIEPREPTVGEDVRVSATTAGRLAQDAALVQLDSEDREAKRWAMASVGEPGAFAHTFAQVREPIRFRVEAGDARSRVFQITPRRPQPQAGEAGSIPGEDATDAGQSGDEAAPSAGEGEDGSVASMLPQLYERLLDLISRAGQLQQRADALAVASPDPEALAALEQDLGGFQEDAAALATDLRDEAQRQDEPIRGQLTRLADALEALGLCRTGSCPNPGDAPGQEPKAGQGSSAGQGAGGSGLGATGQWAAGVRDAGKGAVTTLEALRQRLDASLSGGGYLDANAQATTPPQPEIDAAQGTVTHTQDTADPQRRLRDAILDQAPPAYRDLTHQYFNRLAEEAP